MTSRKVVLSVVLLFYLLCNVSNVVTITPTQALPWWFQQRRAVKIPVPNPDQSLLFN